MILGTAAVVLPGLGRPAFLDPPEGLHAALALDMVERGDWVTPRLGGVRYLDKPPLPYWLMGASFAVAGPSPGAARVWPALAAVVCAGATAATGLRLGGPRLALLAGSMAVANLGVFVFARHAKPDLPLVALIAVAFLGLTRAWVEGRRGGLATFWVALGLAALAKDVLGALGPLLAVAVVHGASGRRGRLPWAPWWGVALGLGVALPWYGLVALRNPGFLWYTVVDVHLLAAARQRVFPDEDVPLGALAFLVVTAAAFLPWTVAVPRGLAAALRRPWHDARARIWAVLAAWAILVVGGFALSPFQLPHYGLAAFPALALLAARAWDAAIGRGTRRRDLAWLAVPLALVLGLAALALGATWAGLVPLDGVLATVAMADRNLAARGGAAVADPAGAFGPILAVTAVALGMGAVGLALAARLRAPRVAAAVAFVTSLAVVTSAGQAIAAFAEARAARPVIEALLERAGSDDTIFHEGALENSASLLLVWRRPVRVVDGLASSLAFGATFPEARGSFLDGAELPRAWAEPGRHFLLSVVVPDRSAVRALPPGSVHLVRAAGGRWLYASRPE